MNSLVKSQFATSSHAKDFENPFHAETWTCNHHILKQSLHKYESRFFANPHSGNIWILVLSYRQDGCLYTSLAYVKSVEDIYRSFPKIEHSSEIMKYKTIPTEADETQISEGGFVTAKFYYRFQNSEDVILFKSEETTSTFKPGEYSDMQKHRIYRVFESSLDKLSVHIKEVNQIPAQRSPQSIVSEVNRMRNEKKLYDLTISVCGLNIQVHRLIMAGASPVFEAMLNNQMRKGFPARITIEYCTYSAIQELVDYIYTRKTPDFQSFSTIQCLDILRAANKFVVTNLASLTLQYLISTIEISNVANVLIIAHQYGILNLKAAALEFICDAFVAESDFHFLEALSENSELWKEIALKSLSKPKTFIALEQMYEA